MSWADAAREGRWADFEGLPDELDMASLLAGLGRQPSWTERPPTLHPPPSLPATPGESVEPPG